ncbi:MAG: hypothetical protein KKA62_00250 [Nanoarchaeota archaeon]|nr:hypothetical protein [Nanoarchaeota archaeon]MBU1976367.1 hypothetical protein [Nanoarchaeota archaeon]
MTRNPIRKPANTPELAPLGSWFSGFLVYFFSILEDNDSANFRLFFCRTLVIGSVEKVILAGKICQA